VTWYKAQPGLHTAKTAGGHPLFTGDFPYLTQSVSKTGRTIKRRNFAPILGKKISMAGALIKRATAASAKHFS